MLCVFDSDLLDDSGAQNQLRDSLIADDVSSLGNKNSHSKTPKTYQYKRVLSFLDKTQKQF